MGKFIIKSFMLVLFLSIGISCSKEDETCIEISQEDCVCTKQYDPVCGCNGLTYGNSCEANCNGIVDYTMGKCD